MKDRFGYGIPTQLSMDSDAFDEVKGMADEDGLDVGKFLHSKAFDQWLNQDFKKDDMRMIGSMYKNIKNSFDDEKEGRSNADKFLAIIAHNKPNNPWQDSDDALWRSPEIMHLRSNV